MTATPSGKETSEGYDPRLDAKRLNPRRGSELSPCFAAVLNFLLGLEPQTDPAVTSLCQSGEMIFAATDADPFFNTAIGDAGDLVDNLNNWADACGVDRSVIGELLTMVQNRPA